MQSFRRSRGFTILEIMIVIVIIGLLASIVAPNLMGSKDKADIKKTVADISAFETSLGLYRLNNKRFPTTEQGLQALVAKPTAEPIPKNYPDEPYIKRLSKDPWGSDYLYEHPGQHSKYDVYSMGPDMEVGTEDDIGNWNLGDYQ
jgi:general secretion pathway protein G